ncbi:MAG: hypothetical protein IBJ03_02460 [Gemmatimonadaceae bacterium]|nr:hypothetical protein [Gemmatimonadaceae bacterium]
MPVRSIRTPRRISCRAALLKWTLVAGLATGLVSACGGSGDSPTTGTPTTPNPPAPNPPTPPASTTPASLAIVAGDGQSGEAGTRLPNALTVLVRNSAGTPLSGVSVEFSVDSGGGTLSGAGAVTNTDGVATSGMWTLGAVGNNVVVARVASLPVVRFRSIAVSPAVRTLIDRTVLSSSGGTITYRKAGDPLDGMSVTVPAGSYSSATTWTITADSVARPTLAQGFSQVGPTITIDNGVAYADSMLSMSIPTTAESNDAIAPFYFDAATGYLEPIPIVERSAGRLAFATRHFSRDLLALPGMDPTVSAMRAASTSSRASIRDFGSVKVVWVKTPRAQLAGTHTSDFAAGRDNWEFENKGHFASPNGSCEGMSITALHYWYFVKRNGAPSLYHRYDKSLTDLLDNVQGERYASAVQADYSRYFRKHGDQVDKLIATAAQRGTKLEELTPQWIVLTLKLLKQPVLIGLIAADAGHAVIATAATYDPATAVTTVTFVDPNFPKAARTMRFDGGTLAPLALSTSVKGPQITFTKAYALAVSAELPMADVSKRWNEFTQKRAGNELYPASYRVERFNELTDSWERLTDTVRTTGKVLLLRHICPGCKSKTTGATADEQFLNLWDGEGQSNIARNATENEPGTTRYYAELEANSDVVPARSSQVDAIPFTVIYSPVEIEKPTTEHAMLATKETWRIKPGALAGPGVTYTWHTDDGAEDVTTTGLTFEFTPKKPGVTNFTVSVKDARGVLVARVSAIRLTRLNLVISPAAGLLTRGVPVTFTLSAVGFDLSSIKDRNIEWGISGGGVNADPDGPELTITRTFTQAGTVKVSAYVNMVEADGIAVPIGRVDEQEYTIGEIPPTWRFTSFNVQIDKSGPNPWLNNPSIGSTQHFTRPEELWPQIAAGIKQGGLLFLERDSTFGTNGRSATLKRRGIYFVDTDQPLTAANVLRYLDVPPFGTTLNSSSLPQVRANWFTNPAMPFRDADVAGLNESYNFSGTVTSGSLSSTFWSWQFSTFKGNGLTLWFPFETRQITVTFGPTTATGTITVISRDFDHSLEVLPRPETKRWTITATFTAERVK